MLTCTSCIQTINTMNSVISALMAHVRSAQMTNFALWVTDLGGPVNLIMLSLVLALLLWLHGKIRHMFQLVLALGTGSFVVMLTKLLIKLPRPDGGLIPASGYSFASGHATIATIFFLLLAYSYKPHIKSSVLRTLFVSMCIGCIILVSFSRVYLGVHYTSDVIAGMLIGSLISAASVVLYERYDRKHPVIQSR
jgi:undecaprenyl-diphosphatase